MDERLNLVLDIKEAARIERLREIIYRKDPVQRARGPLSKSDVARLAVASGLDKLEDHYDVPAMDQAPAASDIEGLDDYEETPEERARIDRMYREAQEQEAREREAAGVGDA